METFTERERVQIGRWGSGTERVTSHPEEVLVTVILVPFPIGRRVVTVVQACGARFAALPLPVRLLQEADQVLVALLLKSNHFCEICGAYAQ